MTTHKKDPRNGQAAGVQGTPKTSTPSLTAPAMKVSIHRQVGGIAGTIMRSVTVKCPYCGKKHFHGWPLSDGNKPAGNRESHCETREDGTRPNGTYRITGEQNTPPILKVTPEALLAHMLTLQGGGDDE